MWYEDIDYICGGKVTGIANAIVIYCFIIERNANF